MSAGLRKRKIYTYETTLRVIRRFGGWHCEHHIVPILGIAHVAYIPKKRVVGISKLARLVDVFAKRLQIQETLTAQIAETMQNVLDQLGVAVEGKDTIGCASSHSRRCDTNKGTCAGRTGNSRG